MRINFIRESKKKTNPYGKPTLDYESGVKVLDMIKEAPTADVFGANAKEEMRQRVLDCAVEIYIAQKRSDT